MAAAAMTLAAGMNAASLDSIHNRIKSGFAELRQQVVKQPEWFIKYPHLIPAGFYSQLWDWDAFFMANHFISKGEPEYMKNWEMTFSQGIDDDGYVAGCMTKDGLRNVYSGRFAMKPFLSQDAYHYSNATDERGKSMIRRHMLSSDAMRAPYGFRSLSKKDVDYNNKNIIVPFSNWQPTSVNVPNRVNLFQEPTIIAKICTFAYS